MNKITDSFLAQDPNQDDIALTLRLGRENPDYLNDPEFAADFKEFETYERSQLGALDYAKQAAGAAVRGAADVVASLPEAAAVAAKSLPIPSIKWGEHSSDGGIEITASNKEDPTKSYTWKLGQAIRNVAKAVTPDEVEALKDSFWATSVPQGVGSAAGFMAGGGVGRAIVGRGVSKLAAEGVAAGMTEAAAKEWASKQLVSRVAMGLPIATMGAAAQGVGGYKEAVNKGADSDAVDASFWWNALGGTSEVVPIAGWLNRLNRASGGTFTKAVMATTKETLEEALQEAAQQVSQNYIAQKYYDHDRDLLKDMAGSAAAGGVVGALFSVLTQGISRSRSRAIDETKTLSTDEAGKAAVATDTNAATIDPTQAYKLDDQAKAGITKLAEREVSGDKSPELFTEVGKLTADSSDPLGADRYGFYRSEVERLKAKPSDGIADEIISEANAAFAKASEKAKETAAQAVEAPDAQPGQQRAIDESLPVEAPQLSGEQVPTPAPVLAPSESQPTTPVGDSKLTAAAPMATPSAAAASTTNPAQISSKLFLAWQKLAAPPEAILERVKEQRASVAKGEAGPGKKSARLFEPLEGNNSDEHVAELYKDNKAGDSRSASRKAAVLLSPDGTHVLVGTATRQPKYQGGGEKAKLTNYVTGYDAAGSVKSRPLDELFSEGWKLVGAIKFDEPTKGYAATHSLEEWRDLSADLLGLRGASQRTAEAMQDTLAQGREFGRQERGDEAPTGDDVDEAAATLTDEETGESVALADAAAPETIEVKGFTDEHAEAVFGDIVGVKEWGEILPAIKSRRGAAGILAAGRALVDAGFSANETATILGTTIYEAFLESGGNYKAFAKAIRDGVSGARSAGTQKDGVGSSNEVRSGASPAQGSSGQATQAGANAGSQAEEENLPVVTVDGLDFRLQRRRGVSIYGEILGTEARDGDPLDVYLGNNPDAPQVWIVDQINPETKKFDEHKAMFGFGSQAQAIAAYDAGFPDGSGPSRRGAVTEMERDEFVDWVNEGGYESGALAYGKKPRLTRQRKNQDWLSATREFTPANGPVIKRATNAEVQRKFRLAVDSMRSRGINIRQAKAAIGELVGEFGRYQEWEGRTGELVRTITLAMSDLNQPSVENFITLLHEAGHAVFANEAPEIQRLLENAIARASNEQLRVGKSVELGDQQERLVEAIAQDFAGNGFDPAASRSLMWSILRMVKAIYHRAAMKLMSAIGMKPSAKLAQAYVSNRLESLLRGDSGYSLASFVGGPLNPAIERYRRLSFTADEETGVSPDQNATALAERDVAAQNEVNETLNLVYRAWNAFGHNPAGLTFEQFVDSGNFVEVDELPAAVIERINQRLANGGQAGVNPALRLSGVTNDSMKMRGASVAHRKLSDVMARMSERRRDAERSLPSLTGQLNRSNTQLHQITSDYTNASTMLQAARQNIKSLLTGLSKSAKDAVAAGKKFGKLEQVIKDIEGRIDTPLLRQYEKAINALYDKLSTTDGGNKFVDTLEAVANLGVDWQNDSTQKIKQTIHMLSADPLLNPLTLDTKEGRAMLALTVAFGKENAEVMGLLELRKTNALAERAAVNKALKLALDDNADGINQARTLTAQLPKLAKTADRLLSRMKELKARNNALIDEIQRERTFVDFHHDTAPLLRKEMAKLEDVFGAANTDWQPTHGAAMLVPPRPGATIEQVSAAKKELDLKRMTTAQIRDDMAKMSEWLDSVPAGDRGAVWETVNQQYNRLAQHDIKWGVHEPAQGSFVNRLLGYLPDRLRFIGTPAARSAAARLDKMVFWQGSLLKRAHELGTKWEVAEGEAMKALGVKRQDVFRRLIYNASLKLIENRQDLLAATTDIKAAEGNAVAEALRYLSSDPMTRDMMARKGAAHAVESYLRQTARNSEFVENARKEMGIKIRDEGDGYSIYREAIGASPFTLMRGINEESHAAFKALQASGFGMPTPTGVEPFIKADVADAYQTDPNGLRTALAAIFTPDIWKRFVTPITNRTGRSSFYAPVNPDGTHNFASRRNVMMAAESAGGDIVRFAENLYRLEGGTGNPAEFVGETLETFQSFYNQLASVAREDEKIEERGLPQPQRLLADARKSEEFPAEWLNFMPYDIHSMRQMAKSQSYQAAFGRNLEAMRDDLATAKAEQEQLARQHDELMQAHPGLSGSKLETAMKATAKAKGLNWTALKEAGRNSQTLTDVGSKFNAMIEMNKTRPPEIEPWAELVGTLSGLLVQSPGTALSDTIAMFEQPFRRFGFSTEALKQIAHSTKSTAVQVFGSMLQALHLQLKAEADYNKLLLDIGQVDDDASLTLKQRMKALMSEQTKAGPLMKPLVYAGRAARTALSTGIGRAQPGASVFPTFKPHAPFTFQAQVVHAGEIIGWWKTYESYIAKALKHFVANPADLKDPAFKFNGKELGLSGRALDYVTESTARYGLSLEQIARDAHKRRQADPNARLMTLDQYRALAAQAQNEITLEANISTRAPLFVTDAKGQLAAPFLGWAVSKGYDAWRGFREPNGKASWRAVGTGLLPYAAILPIGLAYALLRDKYDEEIVGRKQNVRDLTTITDGKDAFLTVLDNAARMGTFGILGEVPNKVFNYDTQRDLSLDNRILFVNSLLATMRATDGWVRQGNADWATVGRPMFQALGGSGYLQYADIINNAIGLDNAEARVSNRISVNNYLRTTGRELEMDVRSARNSAAMPNPIRPYIGQMVMAAMANNATDFKTAWRAAIQEAIEEGYKPDAARDYVKRSYSSYHPLRVVFKTEPDANEYRKLLAAMNEDGRATVATAIRMFNHYGEQVKDSKGNGITPNVGAKPKKPVSRVPDLRALVAY